MPLPEIIENQRVAAAGKAQAVWAGATGLFSGQPSSDAPPAAQDAERARKAKTIGSKTKIYTGLDVGTTKICAIIGQVEPDGRLNVLGVGSTPSLGLRRGIVIDMDETIESIRSAVRKAEEIAHVAVRDVFVGIAGGHIQSHNSTGMVEIKNPSRGITKADIRRVTDRARGLQIPVEREIIHVIPQRFIIDDGVTLNPEGFSSTRLEAEVLIVTAAVTSAQNIVRAVNQSGYHCSAILPRTACLLARDSQRKGEGPWRHHD